jgi:outer membrane protein insertion porin family
VPKAQSIKRGSLRGARGARFGLRLAAALVLGAVGAGALAQEFVIRDIRVEGIQRTEAGTVFSYLPLRVGDRYDPERGSAAIRALFATGLFKDVRMQAEGDVLVVVVEERPAIAEVKLEGVKEFDKETVLKSLREVGLGEARVFDRSLLERAEQELKRQYLGRGLYGVEVKSTVTPVERNRVNVLIAVDEGEAARIRSIRFTGNKAFSDGTLRDQIDLTTSGWLTWYTKRDQYSRPKLAGDLESLRSFYLNRGYLDFSIESAQVSISADKQDIYITINVVEGEKYTISQVKVAGELLGLDEELQALVDVRPGDTYNAERVNAVSKRMTDRFSALGYAFATANAVPETNREKREVAFTYLVDPGRRVYVRRVNIAGNSRTRDEVIRREVRQYENAWFDAEKVRLTRDRIDRLGYFEKVEIETPPVSGSTDQVDVNVRVTERPTGQLQAGAGYSSSEGLVLQGSYSQQNAFGTGHAITFQVNTSQVSRTFGITHTDPYVTIHGISRTIELLDRKSDLAQLGLGTVDLDQQVAGVRYGVPFTEFDTVFFGLRYEGTKIGLTDSSPQVYKDYVADFGDSPAELDITVGTSRDSRDNVLVPSRGLLQRVFLEASLPVLDLRYYRLTYQHQRYLPITNRFTFALNAEIGYGGAYDGKPYPVFKNFYVGGIGSVRGYETASLGPVDPTGTPLGGNRRFNFQSEVLTPIPGADRTLRMFTFLDGGWVWGPDQSVNFNDLRYAAGFGIAWISPMGPMKFSYGYPLNSKPTDKVQRFQFTIGAGF